MTTTAAYPSAGLIGVLRRAEDWLDSYGRGAWIAAMVLGFVIAGPLGLVVLAYMIWGKKMFGKSCRHHRHRDDHSPRSWAAEWGRTAARTTGNAVFDSYKADTLKRLEDEQEAFEAFLQRLRQAKDKTEFDSFMDDRARRTAETDASPADAPADAQARRGEY